MPLSEPRGASPRWIRQWPTGGLSLNMGDAPNQPEQLTYATASSRRGKPFTLREWVPIWIFGVVLTSLVWHVSSGRTRVLSPKTWCSANLRGLGQTLYVYAEDNGKFPDQSVDWQKVLIDSNIAAPQSFVCPCAPKGQTCYYYVPGRQVASDPNQVVVYEDPENHGGEGGNVLFVDSHVEFIKAPKYQALINSLKLPDGRPWAPHLAAKK